MKDEKLSTLLGELSKEKIPLAPENLEAIVLTTIRTERVGKAETILFPSILRFAFVVILLTSSIGWFIGSTQIKNGEKANKLIARNALSLEVFDAKIISFSQTPTNR